MQGSHELTERDAYAQLVGATYPWLAESDTYRASDFLTERMDKYDVYSSAKFTPELASAAEQLGHDFAATFNLSAPSLGTSPSYRAVFHRIAVDALHRVGLGR